MRTTFRPSLGDNHLPNVSERVCYQEQLSTSDESDMETTTLFLDYDGCLHPDDVHRVGGEPVLRAEGTQLFEHADILAELLRPYPQVQIVLSTSWVRVFGMQQAVERLPSDLAKRVVGTTYEYCIDIREWIELSRFDQIMRYVLEKDLRLWIALEGDEGHWPDAFHTHLVCPNRLLGLGAASTRKDLANRLDQMHREGRQTRRSRLVYPEPRASVNELLEMAATKLADAQYPQLSNATRFQAAYDAVLCCAAAVLRGPEAHRGEMWHFDGELLRHLASELGLLRPIAEDIARLPDLRSAGHLVFGKTTFADVEAMLTIAAAVMAATRSRLDKGCSSV